MKTRQQTSRCRVISFKVPGTASAPQPTSALALVCGQHAIDLTGLARSIRADHDLCNAVTGAAYREFGWPSLRVEDAIVLLGARRLRTLLSASIRRGFAIKLRRPFHNSVTPSVNLYQLETFQGELK